jgi:hypothetical protein
VDFWNGKKCLHDFRIELRAAQRRISSGACDIGSALRPSGRGGLSFGLLQNQAFHTTVCIYMKIAIFSYRRARDGRLPRAEAGVVELL